MKKQAVLIMGDTQCAAMLQLYNPGGMPCPNISRTVEGRALFESSYTLRPRRRLPREK